MSYMRKYEEERRKRNSSAQLFYGMLHGGTASAVMKQYEPYLCTNASTAMNEMGEE